MGYSVFILRGAQRELARLPQDAYQRLRDAIEGLSQNPRPTGCLKLAGREGWRIRIGRYRVIYEIDDSNRRITVLNVGHRRDVYD